MRRREEIPMQKVTLSLYRGDFDRLRDYFPKLGASKVVRLLVRKYIGEVEKRIEQRIAKSDNKASTNVEPLPPSLL